jgi:intergrase/recombinase
MSHDDHHHHSHDQSHHNHGTSHSSHSHGALTAEEKLMKMVEHWIDHNEEHAKSYRDWANRAMEIGNKEAALILEEVAGNTLQQNERFRKALRLLKESSAAH